MKSENVGVTYCDVFSAQAWRGNPLAVVRGAQDWSPAQMQAFAHWLNLSETTFLLPPTQAQADYRVRIFTPCEELPFAGHPTLGTCLTWLEHGGKPQGEEVIQECGAGLVRVRRRGSRLAFAAPPLVRSGAVDKVTLQQLSQSLRLPLQDFLQTQWVNNGPGWVAVMLASREAVLALKPDFNAMQQHGLNVGVIAPWPEGEADFEVRAFVPIAGVNEDPVTGSLNAGLAQWLISSQMAPPCYTVSQGTVLGHAGRVTIESNDGEIWVGGEAVIRIEGFCTHPS